MYHSTGETCQDRQNEETSLTGLIKVKSDPELLAKEKLCLPPINVRNNKPSIQNPKAFIEKAVVRRKGFCASNLKLKNKKKRSKNYEYWYKRTSLQ